MWPYLEVVSYNSLNEKNKKYCVIYNPVFSNVAMNLYIGMYIEKLLFECFGLIFGFKLAEMNR